VAATAAATADATAAASDAAKSCRLQLTTATSQDTCYSLSAGLASMAGALRKTISQTGSYCSAVTQAVESVTQLNSEDSE